MLKPRQHEQTTHLSAYKGMVAERINGVYLPRNPKASPLYGSVEGHFDEFERVYDDRFADKHGFWRPLIRKIVPPGRMLLHAQENPFHRSA